MKVQVLVHGFDFAQSRFKNLPDSAHIAKFRPTRESVVNALKGDQFGMTHVEIEHHDSLEAAAEEIFDLTNNPSRQEERERLYGRGPSLSTGDVVVINGILLVCMPMGWETIYPSDFVSLMVA